MSRTRTGGVGIWLIELLKIEDELRFVGNDKKKVSKLIFKIKINSAIIMLL